MGNMLLLYVSANELLGYLTEKYSICISWNSTVLTKTTTKISESPTHRFDTELGKNTIIQL
jgi:hypothetical protein